MKFFDKKWKWAVAGILALVVGLLFYFLYAYFFYACCSPLPEPGLPSPGSTNDSVLNDPGLLYAKRVLIGLCRTKSGSGGSCHFNTYLYSSGKLVIESGELAMMESGDEKTTSYPTIQKKLDQDLMDRITEQIRNSGIMNKPCEAEMIMDYYVNYFINLDGAKKEVRFPGCESEFGEIDKLIDAAADKQP